MNQPDLIKYPRTQHIEGSRSQLGDEDLDFVPWSEVVGRNIVIEEKVDGANAGVRFSKDGKLFLQSRGHFLTGGLREIHFALFKTWAETHQSSLFDVLSDRYIMFGEWLFAKHTIFYDQLPHYFMEFDLYDTQTNQFLDTPTRHELLRDSPVVSVRVIRQGVAKVADSLEKDVQQSAFISDEHFDCLKKLSDNQALDWDQVYRQTDRSTTMEGLYIKIEEDGCVQRRLKFIRSSFLQSVKAAEGHWLNRPIIPNQLKDGVDLFGMRAWN